MRIRHIPQAVSNESLFNTLQQWFRKGAGERRQEIRIMTAFASGKAIKAITPLVDIFLSRGNTIEIILGVDRGGTDKEAINQLLSLQRSYPEQIHAWVFQAPNRESIFHPKLYTYRSGRSMSAVVGSANLTLAGLGSNLESLLLYEEMKFESPEARELEAIWGIFRHPKAPLKDAFLNRLSKAWAEKHKGELPSRSSEEGNRPGRKLKELWRPLSGVKLPQSGSAIQARRRIPDQTGHPLLLIDVLRETRETQMQFPLGVIEQFWGIRRDKPSEIYLRIWTSEGLSQPIQRTVVISSGGGKRLMRRIEMPPIRMLSRPLVAIFGKLSTRRTYAYILLPRSTACYKKADLLLRKHGQQGKGVRRYLIATGKEELAGEIGKIKKLALRDI